jgi:hypothetical protein
VSEGGEDLDARIDALEAQVDALTKAIERRGDTVEPSRPDGDRGQLTRRGLISAAAGAVAGGAAAALVTTTQDSGVDAHIDDASGAHDASAISLEPSGELVATDVSAALADLDARLAALLQYSPDSLQDYAVAYDEFFGASTADGQVGGLGWSVVTEDGASLAPAAGALANTPGWYELRTGDSSATGRCALHQGSVSLQGHPIFVWEVRIAPRAVNADGQTSTWRIGLHDDVQGEEPANGFYFEQTADSPVVRCRTAQAGTRTDADSGVELEPGTAHRLRIASDGGGAAYFSVDDEVVATVTEGLPTAAGESYGPSFTLAKTAGTGTSHSLVVDYFYLLWGVSR